MGSLGFPELIVIAVVALLLFGPRRLPEAGKALGQAIRGFKGAFEAKEEAPASREAPPEARACPGCAKPVEADAAFCHHCGRPLATSAQDKAA